MEPIWIAAQAAGLVLWPVLKDLAQDGAKDSVKDYVKKCFPRVFSAVNKEPLERATLKAVSVLLEEIQHELNDTGMPLDRIARWIDPIKQFVEANETKEAIRQAFLTSDSHVDPVLFAQAWQPFADSHPLTEDFSWQRIARRFGRAVLKLRIEDKELGEILSKQAAVENAEASKQMAGVPVDFRLDGYRQALRKRYGSVRLDSLDATGAYYQNIVQLRRVFVEQTVRESQTYAPQLLELPREHLRRLQQSGDAEAIELAEELLAERRRAYFDQAPRPALEAVGDTRQRLQVILGDPGSGKSSLLRFLALQWAESADATAREAAPVPILIELREYNAWRCDSGRSFVRYLNDAPTYHRLNQLDLHARLQAHPDKTVLLLDGLDEIFNEDERERAVNDIQRFTEEYAGVRVLLTSRIIGYHKSQPRMIDLGFIHLTLQELEEAQIADFLDRWHAATLTDADERKTKQERLAAAIAGSRAIRELAGNPLLLTMMAVLNRHQELPRDRAALYEQSSRLLLYDWKTEHLNEKFPQLKAHGIGYPEKADMLREVAYAMQTAPTEKRGNIIAREELERILRDYLKDQLGIDQPRGLARDLVEQLRGQNFILCDLGDDNYAFVHRTFLEFFCASAAVKRFRQQLTLEYLKEEFFGRHWNDESWHETLRLIMGMVGESSVEQAAALIDYLLNQKCDDYNFRNVFLAADCCYEVRMPKALGAPLKYVVTKLQELLRLDFSTTRERDKHVLVAMAINYLASELFIEAPQEWLKEHALHDHDAFIRQAALEEMRANWSEYSGMRSLLHDCLQDSSDMVRQKAVDELGYRWCGDTSTLLRLFDRATRDEDWNVRLRAVEVVARGWKDNPDTLPWLKDCTAHEHVATREAAVRELAQGWRNDPDTLPMLHNRVIDDTDEWVRYAALQGLVRGWKAHPDTVRLLCDRAAYDSSDLVRKEAIEELARGWSDTLEVSQFLNRLKVEQQNRTLD